MSHLSSIDVSSIDDDADRRLRTPQAAPAVAPREVYTITKCLPIEGDGLVRYRIRSATDASERVATEDELSRLD
jgi:hypothetical protein